jgi:hypothetical protein
MKRHKFLELLYNKFPNAELAMKTNSLPEILKIYAIFLFTSGDVTSELAKEIRKQLSNLSMYGEVKFD